MIRRPPRSTPLYSSAASDVYKRQLLGGFGGIFSANDVIYHCNPQKALRCAETRRLSHKAWKSVQQFDLGAGWRKKDQETRTGQDSKKVTKALYFTYLGRSPRWTDFHKKLHSSRRPRRNHVCKLLSWNFQGLRFYLSLIHIWRCRRIERCRSRWSPYH